MSGLLCAGDLYIDRFDENGASTGLVKVGNATRFQVQEPSEVRERISKQRATYGQALDTVYVKQPATLAITLDEIDRDNLSLALLGSNSSATVASGSVTDEAVDAIHDAGVELANRNITSGTVVVEDVTDTTTYVDGTDYTVDYRLGIITVLSTGSIADGETLHVDYDHGGVTGNRVSGGARPTIRAALLLDGKNLANDEQIIVKMAESTLTPSSAVDFLADDFVSLELEGRPVTQAGASSSYTVDVLSA